MAALVIQRNPEVRFDLSDALYDKLNMVDRPEVITREVALRTLNRIQREAKIKSFFTKPVVVLTGIVLITAVLLAPIFGLAAMDIACLATALKIASSLVSFTGAFAFTFAFKSTRSLSALSTSYNTLAIEAAGYIQNLKADPEKKMVVIR